MKYLEKEVWVNVQSFQRNLGFLNLSASHQAATHFQVSSLQEHHKM